MPVSIPLLVQSIAVSALIASSLSTTNAKHGNDLSDISSDSSSDAGGGMSTTKLGLQRFDGIDTYVPGTMPECLYKRAQLVHDNYEEGFLLSVDDFAPTASEVAAVEAEVDIALTQAIETINKTARSGRHVKPTQKVKLNTEQELAFR
jgi:hypothetical protein